MSIGEVVARLQRFYGGEPLSWYRLPLGRLRAYMELIAPLEASEGLTTHAVTAAATGNLKAHAADNLLADLRRTARAVMHTARARKPHSLDQLRGMGIAVDEVRS